MKITVKQKHIDKGEKTKAMSCPIALAIKDYYWFPRRVVVGHCCCFIGKNMDKTYPLPKEVTNFIQDFDMGLEVKPFSFEI